MAENGGGFVDLFAFTRNGDVIVATGELHAEGGSDCAQITIRGTE